jgi:anti-sigma regulatory factor (Ser/Thr protein kinase)
MDSPEILRLRVSCDSTAPGIVRKALEAVAPIDGVKDDARLLASELVTNAVVHSAGGSDDTIEVFARLGRDRLTIAVHDPGFSDRTPQSPSRDDDGMGLRIVEEIARRWGTERPDGLLVWAELEL